MPTECRPRREVQRRWERGPFHLGGCSEDCGCRWVSVTVCLECNELAEHCDCCHWCSECGNEYAVIGGEATGHTCWNPRYLAYGRAHGKTPDEMIEHDRERWPGGVMCGFIIWINEKWAAWEKETGFPRGAPRSSEHHAAFDRWLDERTIL